MKIIYSFLLTLSLITLSFSANLKLKYTNFSSDNVINHITELSSEKYEGRLPGNEGNVQATKYIQEQMINYKLKPYEENYLDVFSLHTPTLEDSTPTLEILDKNGQIVHEFKYGVDFKESFLNFKINKFKVNTNDKWRVFSNAIEIITSNNESLVFSVINEDFNFRSSFVYDNPIDLSILITEETNRKILDYYKKGYSFNLNIPYKAKENEINNVVGYIKGKDSSNAPLVLSAHFDHMGKDLLGNIYPGALDNASGTAFLLELSRYLNSLPTPNRDIIIVAFNAEEFGLLGSKHFAQENSENLQDSKVINFDMIGSNNDVPLTLMTGSNATHSSLINSLSKIAEKQNTNYLLEISDASDHASFSDNGVNSITLCDFDTTRIHSPQDKVEFIDKNSIIRAFNLVITEIINSSYNNNSFLLYSPVIFYSSLIISFLLVSIPLIYGLFKTFQSNNNHKKK